MKKLLVLIMLLGLGVFASADVVYTFTPESQNLMTMNHSFVYYWTIDLGMVEDPQDDILGAQLKFNQIYDWDQGTEDDALYVHLIDVFDSNGDDVVVKYDPDNTASYFEGIGTEVAAFNVSEDIGIGAENAKDIVIDFDESLLATLKNYVSSDGKVTIGLDPDCHYSNTGVEFSVSVVPAPGAALLTGLGTMLAGWLKRRRSL